MLVRLCFNFVLKNLLSLHDIYLILYTSECCQPLLCQNVPIPSAITAVMVIFDVVIKLIINQGFKQFSTFLWDWLGELANFPCSRGDLT